MHLGTMKFKQRGREEQAEAEGAAVCRLVAESQAKNALHISASFKTKNKLPLLIRDQITQKQFRAFAPTFNQTLLPEFDF